MKRLVFLVILVIVAFTVYIDISKGTIPVNTQQVSAMNNNPETKLAFVEMKVTNGDTVFTLFKKANGSYVEDIDRLIKDFKKLNNNVDPVDIQIDKEYKIPIY